MEIYEKAVKNIRLELKNYVIDNNLKSLILGISGGVDSALVAALAAPVCRELNIPLIGRSISIATNTQDEKDRAKKVGEAFCSDFKEMDLTNLFNDLKQIDSYDTIPKHDNWIYEQKIRMGNIKARIRSIYLYDLASKYHGLVLSTDNWTEFMLSFFTLHGDHFDYGMIQSLWKTEVYDMADWLIENELKNEQSIALSNCITCMATDGLGITDRGDLGQILPEWEGSSREGYRVVDNRLSKLTLFDEVDETDPVYIRHKNTEFKRNWPINIKRENIF